jgi:predicted enzyme related to lactoylglutathione lyase
MEKVEALGGSVVAPKMTVPGWGYLAVCRDTEQNLFGLWEENNEAK